MEGFGFFLNRFKSGRILNFRMVSYVLGILLLLEGILYILCCGVSLYYHESGYKAFIYCFIINAIAGTLFVLFGKSHRETYNKRDGIAIVTFTWISFAVSGMFPFLLSGEIPNPADAFFETMSGFTTTGASILDDVESMSHGMLFWRATTHFMGGLGMVCFIIAIMPIFGRTDEHLFSAEATGVFFDKTHPRITVMLKWIWSTYIALTAVVALLMWLGGMSVFDAVCHAFATTATGGFSTKQNSLAYWDSPYLEYVTAVSMILSGINFSLYYFLFIKRDAKKFYRDREMRWFLSSVGIITLLITLALFFKTDNGLEESFRKAFFQTASLHTSTGFVTDDFALWPQVTWILLLFAMVAGGCTGSTSGGLKSMRVMIAYFNIKNEFKRLVSPNIVLPITINHQQVPQSKITAVFTFIVSYLFVLTAGTAVLMCFELGFEESAGMTVASLGNAGPALGDFGPANSWSALPDFCKWFLSFIMLIGRLELFKVLVFFHPAYWTEY